MRAAGTSRKGQRGYRKHRSVALAAALKRAGLDALDGRLSIVRGTREWLAAYAADRGGEDGLGVGYRTLLDAAGPERLIVEHIGGILMAQPAWIMNRRKRQMSQLARDYLVAVKHLRDTLVVLGLDRRPRELPGAEILHAAAEQERAWAAQDAARTAQGRAVDVQADPVPSDAPQGESGG